MIHLLHKTVPGTKWFNYSEFPMETIYSWTAFNTNQTRVKSPGTGNLISFLSYTFLIMLMMIDDAKSK